MSSSKVSCIIPHHTGRLIDHCLYSLKDLGAEIIIVTTDWTYPKPFGVKILYLTPELNNPAFKRNKGAELATGDYLVFMDDDIEVQADTLINTSHFLKENKDWGMLYAHLFKMDNHDIVDTSGSYLSWNGFLWETYYKTLPFPLPVLSGKSAYCAIRKDVFKEIGGFDESFVIYGEETDLSWRVWKKGYKVMILPQVKAYHAFETPLKPRSYYNQYYIHYHGCKNYLTMLLKNLPWYKLYIVPINAFCWLIMACFLAPKKPQAARWILQGIIYVFKHIVETWGKRTQNKGTFLRYVCKNPPLGYYFNRFKGYWTHQLHG